MRAKLLGLVTGVALLSSIGVASAGNPIALTDAQLDTVTAGVAIAIVVAVAVGGTADGTFLVSANNTSATVGSATAAISASFTPTGTGPHSLSLLAFASAP
jgi:hypothetical protein